MKSGRMAVIGLAGVMLAVVATARASTITPLVMIGDPVDGVGLVTRIDDVAVNDAGTWVVEADTDFPSAFTDSVILRDGTLDLREGQSLPAPAGATLDYFGSLNLDADGVTRWNLGLSGLPFLQDTGLFAGTELLIQAGAVSTAPEFAAGTIYQLFHATRTAGDGLVLAAVTVDDPSIATSSDPAFVLVQHDVTTGEVTEHVVLKEGDVPPGQTAAIAQFQFGSGAFAVNEVGNTLIAIDLEGSGPTDTAVYLDDTLIAQEGHPSPTGALWAPLAFVRVALDANGTWALQAKLYSTPLDRDTLIVRDGVLFQEKGALIPGLDVRAEDFGTGPILLTPDGRLLWFASWDDADPARGSGLLLEREFLVEQGRTSIDGALVTQVNGVFDQYAMSPSGRFVIFTATLDDGRSGAFLLDRAPTCAGDVDADGTVDMADLMALFAIWGPCPAPCAGDIDGDGVVGFLDLLAVLSRWGSCP